MKRIIVSLLSIMAYTLSLSGQIPKIFATHYTGSMEKFNSVDISTGDVMIVANLPGVDLLYAGESTYDVLNDRYIVNTNIGVTFIEVETGDIIATIENPDGVHSMEYDYLTDKIYGVDLDGSEWRFVMLDLSDTTYSVLDTLDAVNTFDYPNTAYDHISKRYFCQTNLGLTIIDANTGTISDTIDIPGGYKGIEYDHISNNIYTTYYDFDNNDEWFVAADLSSHQVDYVAILPGVTSTLFGESTFDHDNLHYITRTNLGITIIDIEDGSIVNTIPVTNPLKHLEYGKGPAEPLELNILHFSARSVPEGEVCVNWNLASLQGIVGISLERACDLYNWMIFHSINLFHGTETTINGSVCDERPCVNESYYRLKIVHLDGSVSYSGIETIHKGNANSELYLNVYPNPTHHSITLTGYLFDPKEVQLIDIRGKPCNVRIMEETHGYGPYTLSLAQLPAGIYYLKVGHIAKPVCKQ